MRKIFYGTGIFLSVFIFSLGFYGSYRISQLKDEVQELEGFRLKYQAREFDSWIIPKIPAGRIRPAFFVSNILFLYMLFYVIVWYNKG